MIISKAALMAVRLSVVDKDIPLLRTMCIEADGTVVVSNGRVVLCVSPVPQAVRKNVPLGKLTGSSLGCVGSVLLSVETVEQIIKAIPRDTMFKGLLEHCDITAGTGNEMKVTTTDGKRSNAMSVKRVLGKWVNFKAVLRHALSDVRKYSDPVEPLRVILNRKRLSNLTDVVDKVLPYDGDFAPVFMEFTAHGDVVFRGENELTGQKLIAVFKGVENVQNHWPNMNDWETKLIRTGAVKL